MKPANKIVAYDYEKQRWIEGQEAVQVLHKQLTAFQVELSNVGNPDYRQDSERPLPDTLCGWASCNSLKECAEICRSYISCFDLGAGNWTGGTITGQAGLIIGRVSYNGRIWDDKGKEICAS